MSQLFEGLCVPVVMVDRLEQAAPHKLCQFISVDPIAFVPDSERLVLTRIADDHFCNQWFDNLVKPRCLRALLKSHMHSTRQTVDEIANRVSSGSYCTFGDCFAVPIYNGE